MKLLLTAALTVAITVPQVSAFDFQVKNIEQVAVKGAPEAYHPVFSVDGQSLLVTSEGYDGLGIVGLRDGRYRQLSNRAGAGYRFAQNQDGSQIVLRENDFITQKLSLYLVDVETATEQCLVPVAEHTNALRFDRGVVAYGEPVLRRVATAVDPAALRPMSASQLASAPLLTNEDLKMVLYVDGERRVIDPILETTGRDVNYTWESMSPDGTRLLFVAHNTCYTSNLDGSDLVDLGTVHAPVWRDDNTVIGMVDSDNGHFFVASDIVAVDSRTSERLRLTPESDEIKMYPSVSPDGNRIAFHTTQGKLYIINLENK